MYDYPNILQESCTNKPQFATLYLLGLNKSNERFVAQFTSLMAVQLVEALCYKLEGRGFDSR
jgi:hypothetical protein